MLTLPPLWSLVVAVLPLPPEVVIVIPDMVDPFAFELTPVVQDVLLVCV
jgi:hypothetical protein